MAAIKRIFGRDADSLYTISMRAEVIDGFIGVSLGLLVGERRDVILKLPAVIQSIHTFLMRYPIVVIFLDEDLKIINVARADPGMIIKPARKAAWCVELGTTDKTLARPGDSVVLYGWTEEGLRIEGGVE